MIRVSIVILTVVALSVVESRENVKSTLSCGIYGNGDAWLLVASVNQYYQCLNGNSVLKTCPNGLIFHGRSSNCVNPCTSFDSAELYTTYYVGDPNDPSNYYQCNGPYVVTPGTTGSPSSSPIAITAAQRSSCPSGEQFYPALGSLSIGSGCMNPTDLLALCPPPPSSYAVVPILPADISNSRCTISTTPYYLVCRDGTDVIVQRCPRGSIVYDGSCMSTGQSCTSSSEPNICICA